MKPAPFELHSPETREEVLELLARYGEDARVLAGGQSLVPLLNMRMAQPTALISINRCQDLAFLDVHEDHLSIGALVRQSEAERHSEVRRVAPLLAETLPLLGGKANRNRGTVCGSLAHADPLAELPAVALALEATMTVRSAKASRTVAAADFFTSALMTCIEPGEMLESVAFPVSAAGDRSAFLEVGNRRHGFAVAGIAVHLSLDSAGTLRTVRLAAIGAGETPLRLAPAENILVGQKVSDELLDAAAQAARDHIDPIGDFHADGEYRRNVIGTLVKRTVHVAIHGEPARTAA